MSQIFFELFACIKLTFEGKLTSDAGKFLKANMKLCFPRSPQLTFCSADRSYTI